MACTLVLPTLNEARALPFTLVELARLRARPGPLRELSILVVDGGSRDATGRVAEVWGRRLGLEPAWLPPEGEREGLAASLLRGLKLADTRYCFFMDADGSHPPALLPGLYAALEKGAAMALASRWSPGASAAGMALERRLAARLCAAVSRPFFGIDDPLTGCGGLDLQQVRLPAKAPEGFKLAPRLLQLNPEAEVVQVPYTFRARQAGKSKLDRRTCLAFLRQWLAWTASPW